MKTISAFALVCSLTACNPTIIGDWELSYFDEEVLKESIEDSLNDDFFVERLELDWSFSVDESLEGEGETVQNIDIVYSDSSEDYDISLENSRYGNLEVVPAENEYKIEFILSGETRAEIPYFELEETEILEDNAVSLVCSLSFGFLTCEDGTVSDMELVFRKR